MHMLLSFPDFLEALTRLLCIPAVVTVVVLKRRLNEVSTFAENLLDRDAPLPCLHPAVGHSVLTPLVCVHCMRQGGTFESLLEHFLEYVINRQVPTIYARGTFLIAHREETQRPSRPYLPIHMQPLTSPPLPHIAACTSSTCRPTSCCESSPPAARCRHRSRTASPSRVSARSSDARGKSPHPHHLPPHPP